MTPEQARKKWNTLRNITVERGCSKHEAATAQRLARQLEQKYGLGSTKQHAKYREGFEDRFKRAEKRAAVRWRWEYRQCGKCCKCAFGFPHGPYKYSKQRRGKKVVSIYIGK